MTALAASYPLQTRIPFHRPLLERSSRLALASALRHAYERVPLYRERFEAAGLTPADLRRPADLARLPLLDRDVVHEDPEAVLSDLHARESLIESRTSGSSGMPVRFYVDMGSMLRGARLQLRRAPVRRALTGRRFGHRRLSFSNPTGGGHRRRAAFGEMPFVSRFRAPEPVPTSAAMPVADAVRTIAATRAEVVGGFGSYVEAVFAWALEHGEPLASVRLVTFGGDAMTPAARAMIERDFGVPVRSHYAATEAPLIGFECERGGGFHLNQDMLPVRIVGEDGADVPEGEPGEVVVSNLISRGSVLINYRLGDRARLLPGPCPCGRVLPRLGEIEGRAYDWLIGSDGERVHPEALGSGFRRLPGVRRFQIVQRSPREFVVRVVGAEIDEEDLAERLRPDFRRALGPAASVSVVAVGRIEPIASGKVKRVVCELPPDRPAAGAVPASGDH